MTSPTEEQDEAAARRTAMAVGTLFFVNGMTFSNWLPRIPEVRDKLGVDNAGLGTALLGGGLGGLIGSLLVAKVLARYCSRQVLLTAATCLALCLPLIAFAPSAIALTLVLTLLGFLDVLNDMSMNTQGVMAESLIGRSIMNRLHGGWSLGFLVGAVIGLAASAAELDIRIHLILITVVLLGAVFSMRSRLLPVDVPTAADGGHASGGLSLMIVAIAVMAVGVGWMESIPNDWGSVLLSDEFDAGRWSGASTVSFALAMLIGRMLGDAALDRFGRKRMLSGALGLCALGTLVVVSAPVAGVAGAGFVCWGLGVSVLFPQLYAIAATLNGVAPGAGLGAMGVGQRLGFLMSPVLMGALADWRTVQTAMLIMLIVAFASVLSTRRIVERSQ